MNTRLDDAAERLLGLRPVSVTRFAGGDISGASLLRFADGTTAVGKTGPVVAVEARMLQAMAQTAAPVPQVLAYDEQALLIAHVPADGSLSGTAWLSLAEALRGLHASCGTAYGWEEDYALRHVVVENAWHEDWPQFWSERRLLCHTGHLAPALSRRIETLAASLPDRLPQAPPASLVHGDLWGGNILVSHGAISGLIDPCAYYGCREVDIASLTVFDDPPAAFFDAMDMAPGWKDRLPIYRLWMWLLHVRLFGDSYRAAVESELDALGC